MRDGTCRKCSPRNTVYRDLKLVTFFINCSLSCQRGHPSLPGLRSGFTKRIILLLWSEAKIETELEFSRIKDGCFVSAPNKQPNVHVVNVFLTHMSKLFSLGFQKYSGCPIVTSLWADCRVEHKWFHVFARLSFKISMKGNFVHFKGSFVFCVWDLMHSWKLLFSI